MAPMTMQACVERDGIVVEAMANALFLVEFDSTEQIVAHLFGKPRRNFVRILEGDRVTVTLLSRNRTLGRITSRCS